MNVYKVIYQVRTPNPAGEAPRTKWPITHKVVKAKDEIEAGEVMRSWLTAAEKEVAHTVKVTFIKELSQ